MVLLLQSLCLAITFLACSASFLTPASLTIPGTDHHALMSFKSFIRSDPSNALASWGTGNLSVPMSQWRGVTCGLSGRRRGRVVALDLAKLNLLGTITPALGNLTYMRRLYLPSNRFHGTLPPELGNLHDLETLELTNNFIAGHIPLSLSNCSHLVHMVLDSNKLDGGIPSKLTLLHKLEVLDLSKNKLTGSIPSDIGNLVNLRVLGINYNNLTGEIPQEIGNLVNLKKLGLFFNQLSGPIPVSLGNLSALTLLGLYSNKLTGIIPPLQGLSSLRYINLGLNNLEGSIPTWLGNLSSLQMILLNECNLEGSIPESLGNLKLLTDLFLSRNNLRGPVPHAIGNMYYLNTLHIQYNQLEGPLTPSIFNLSSLQEFVVQFNRLSGSFPLDIGSTLPNLQIFEVDENQFLGTIPPSLCNASMIQMIQGVNNLFSGTIPGCLGAQQKNLVSVAFAQNQLETTNDFDWRFMSSLNNCSNLQLLDLGDNYLRGALPNSVGNLSTSLEYFVINYNHITGKIPEGIGNLVNLQFIEMNNNLFEGTIPASFGQLKKLNQPHLTYNNLSGSVPLSFSNLQMLTVLSLGGNALSGEIPPSLSNCPLEKLDLSLNRLSGLVPKELFSISTLSDYLHLEHNFLTGPISSEVGNLTNLGLLDLSDNMISGEIPSSIGECHSLQYLNTSGNYLRGKIPPSLDQLTGLLVLDLSHNNLSGSIPKFLATMRGLASLNLSFDNLHGDVPTGGVFANATFASVMGNEGLCNGIPQLKLPPCSSSTTKKPSQKLVIIISICTAFVFSTLVFALSICYQRRRKIKVNMQTSLTNEQYLRISYAELVNATNGFAPENLLGAGSFGSVYKGTMRSNDQQIVVAVKVLNLTQRGASQSFVAECETLKCVRHRNLVKILTVCSSIDFQGRDFKALVYEFLPNGNLDKWLHQYLMEDGEVKGLDLEVRLQIASDVASSLEYLHQHKPVPIIHCDLKPSNVLLNSEMVAHVGDFGLARFLHQDYEKSSGWASMRGTIGYAAPEYGLGNEVTTQGDVYSYGILLLEMFTGKRPTDGEFGEALGLHKYVQMALAGRVASVIDQQFLRETEDGEASTSNSRITRRGTRIACISSILRIGIACSAEMPTDRVQIGDALKELQTIGDKFDRQMLREEEPGN